MAPLHDLAFWTSRRETLRFQDKALIGGAFVPARSGATFDCVSPLDGRILARIACCDEADVDRAVAAARRAFDAGPWPRMAARERKTILQRLADLIARDEEELALLETLDMGMPIRDSVLVDVPLSAECVAWYGEAIDKRYDEIAPTGPDAVTLIRKAPLGVVGAVTPWNYPLMIACWKLGPILATGNTMVLKPAEQSPLTALRLATLAAEAGLPEGVLNVVPGFGHTAGQALGRHMDVDALTFTGSTAIGKRFLCYAGESNMKKVTLECGGKTPNIVLEDVPDIDKAAKAITMGIFFNQGEVCNAGSRVIVEESLREDLVARIIAESGKYRPGNPLDPETVMGAMVDEAHTDRVLDYIRVGEAEGASVVTGGGRARGQSKGCFIEPTVLDRVTPSMRVAREEIFGPVLSVLSVSGFDEAIRVANDTIYGLGAGVWTGDIVKAHRAADRLRAGVVWINGHDLGDISAPVGGFGQSGFGRDKSLHAMEKYQDYKTMWINLL